MLIHAADWMSLSKHNNKHRKESGYSIWSFDGTGKQDTVRKFLSTGTAQHVLPLLELPTLLEDVFQDFLTSSHKNKAIQKFQVLF